MRRTAALLAIMILLSACAAAEAFDPAQAWEQLKARLDPYGLASGSTEKSWSFDLPDGRQALSLCLTVEGDLRFGRYAQLTAAALLDAQTGEELALEDVFPDTGALQAFLDDQMENGVQETLNTYLDAGDLLPVPTDTVCFDVTGATFHYPSERFMYFSGHAGALHLYWYQLEGLTGIAAPAWQFPDLTGRSIDGLLELYGSLTDPDLIAGGEIYEFEDPALRGVQAIADDTGTVTCIRTDRFDLGGVRPGMSRDEAETLLGPPQTTVALDGAAALNLRLREGTAALYPDYHLYYDGEGLLYMARTPDL